MRVPFLVLLASASLMAHHAAAEPRPATSTQTALKAIREKYSFPALGALSLHYGQTHATIDGVRKWGDPTPATVDDQFHLGSCTKAMTATLVALHIERGQLWWKAKVADLLPELAPSMHPKFKGLTLEMLLSHRSGLARFPGQAELAGAGLLGRIYNPKENLPKLRQDYVRMLLSNPPQFDPDTRYSYSNSGYLIVGAILEKVTGKAWEDLIRTELFAPLNMTSCGFGAPGSERASPPVQPWGHTHKEKTPQPAFGDNPAVWGPAGTVHCSMKDWSKFIQLHIDGFNGRPTRLMRPESFRRLYETPPGQEYTFGGWHRVKRKWAAGDVLMHTGTNLMNYSTVWIAPRRNTAFLAVTNDGGERAIEGLNEVIRVGLKEVLP